MKPKNLYFSSRLQKGSIDFVSEFETATERLVSTLDTSGAPYDFIANTNDIWARDYMPVQTKSGTVVSFRYEPSYHETDEEKAERTSYRDDLADGFPLPVIYSDINLDGGNVVFSPSKNKMIISDRVFEENKGLYSPNSLSNAAIIVRSLERLLESQIIIIPADPDDYTGHADGMVRFVDEYTVVGNRTKYALERDIKKVLNSHGIDVIDFPWFDSEDPINEMSAVGCYINFLETEECILLPEFYDEKDNLTFQAKEMDKEAIRLARELFNKPVLQVNINEIAIHGGVLNCISWEY